MDRPRVLIADDDDGILAALTDLLTEEGMDVVGAAHDGREAIELARERLPDVILMDLKMPGIDGLEATQRIRADNDHVQVVILSAYDEAVIDAGAQEAGAYAYLVKGCSAGLIGDLIRKAYSLKKGLEIRAGRQAG